MSRLVHFFVYKVTYKSGDLHYFIESSLNDVISRIGSYSSSVKSIDELAEVTEEHLRIIDQFISNLS